MRKPPGTLRTAADLIGAGLLQEAKRDAIERVAAAYAIGVTATIASLIDPTDAARPDRPPVYSRLGRTLAAAGRDD